LHDRDVASAVVLLEELVRMRRFAEDWRLLGMCYLEQRQPQKALAALKQALAIRPFRPDIHDGLAQVYRQLRDEPHAREHLEKARWLFEHKQE
jgi:Tfp pilus assembly protein PilF